jgi:hypothetical protein
MKRIVPSVLLLLACSDYNLEKQNEGDKGPGESGDTHVEDSGEATDEECNGVDDDGDGLIDEGYPDVDGDGDADCIDEDCGIEMADPLDEFDDSCDGDMTVGDPPEDPWSWLIEWQWLGGGVLSTPSVGDLDADGVPEVVVVSTYDGNSLVVFDGASGAIEYSIPGFDSQSGTALGDVDGDGYGNIIATTGSCYTAHDVYALDHTGATLWVGATTVPSACETYPVITDLEGDGSVEVIVNEYVYDGATGAVEAVLTGAASDNWGAVAVADLDLDGTQEIMIANKVFSATGTLLMTCGSGGVGSFPQPVNVDSDTEGEVLVAGNGSMTLCDDDGTVLWTRTYSGYGAPIAVADFDDDGLQEFAFAKTGAMMLIEGDNTVLWSTPIADYSGLAGATSWDVDLDGVPEVVYADENDILVLNGATGAVELREPSHGSVTLAETPAVADVDGDGHGELVYGSNSGLTGVTVVGGADGDWPYSKPVYNQYTYYGANIEDDLSVPLSPDPPWIYEANLFRGQPSAVYVAGSPNLRARITDVCIASCEELGYAAVAGQVFNDGGASVDAGVTVRVYGTTSSGLTLIYDDVTPVELASRGSWEFSFDTRSDLIGSELLIVVDEDEQVEECNEDDNHGSWTDIPCE